MFKNLGGKWKAKKERKRNQNDIMLTVREKRQREMKKFLNVEN